ncbi:MAG TPA: hypothetical protein VGM56_30530, partial [Byssovorax sp.]
MLALGAGSLLAAAACGSDTTTGSTDGSTEATTGGAGGADTGANGCTTANTVDETANSDTTVNFGGTLGLIYSPACITITKGSTVTFVGDFVSHPLAGGLTTNDVQDPTSSIQNTTSGTTATFTFPNA